MLPFDLLYDLLKPDNTRYFQLRAPAIASAKFFCLFRSASDVNGNSVPFSSAFTRSSRRSHRGSFRASPDFAFLLTFSFRLTAFTDPQKPACPLCLSLRII